MTNPTPSLPQAVPSVLTQTDIARIYRRVFGGNRWPSSSYPEFAYEIEREALSRMGGEAVPAWQPIATAPKSSRAILVFCSDRRNTYAVSWDASEEIWRHFGGGCSELQERPTHWQPLPADPTAPAQQAAPSVVDHGLHTSSVVSHESANVSHKQAADVQGEPLRCDGCGKTIAEHDPLLNCPAAAQSVPKGVAVTAEIDLLLADPGSTLSRRAREGLEWLRTQLAASAPTVGGLAERIRRHAETHVDCATGQDELIAIADSLAAQEPSAADALLHRLWLEGGGNANLKPGEVTEQNVADLLHGLNKLADDAIAAEEPSAAAEPETEDEMMTRLGSPPRKFKGWGDCRCILSKYCDGRCNPIYEDATPPTPPSAPAGIADALRENTRRQYEADQSTTPEFMQWLATKARLEGVGANEAWNAGVAWARSAAPAGAGEGETVTVPRSLLDGMQAGIDRMREMLDQRPAPPSHEGPDARDAAPVNERLLALADRIDHESLWARAGLERPNWTQEQHDRCDAGVELRRYAALLGQDRWRIFTPNGPVRFSATTLDAAYAMAKRDDERRAARAGGEQ